MSENRDTLLHVDWSMLDPPVAATAWTPAPAPLPAASELDAARDASLETALAWPPATIATLRAAFQARLSRSTGWQLAADTSLAAAQGAAATVFKRGVVTATASAPTKQRSFSGRYPVAITFGPSPPAICTSPQRFTIVDSNVAKAWPDLAQATPLRFHVSLDEHRKTLQSVAELLTAWRAAGRPAAWTVVGGGILTDIAAFAATIAGATIAFVPTTLLAMADACIGGKTGVNFAPFGKNQVGRFAFPTAVHAWTGWLATLPPRELHAGGAECMKHAFLLGDEALANRLASALAAKDLARLASYLPRVVSLKTEVVTEDPNETGRRATLNLGHTLAHALEAVSQAHTQGEQTLLHGEAVGIGLHFAIELSLRTTGLPIVHAAIMRDQLDRAGSTMTSSQLAARLGFPSLADPTLFTELARYIANDKKNVQSDGSTDTDWILLADLGEIARGPAGEWTRRIPLATVEACWRQFQLGSGGAR